MSWWIVRAPSSSSVEALEAFRVCIVQAAACDTPHAAAQSNHREVVSLGPISMGERLRIGGDISSDEDMDEATPSPAPSSPKRSHKRRVLPPRSLNDSEFLHALRILIVKLLCQVQILSSGFSLRFLYHCEQWNSGLKQR